MKMTNRQRNSVIIHVFFYTVLLIVLLYLLVSFFYPKIISLEQRKEDTRTLSESIESVEKSWITFEEFQALSSGVEKSSYVTEVLKSITKDFYSENLMNNDFQKFSDFLDSKKIELNSDEVKDILNKRDEKIVQIFPSYSDSYVVTESDSLTDFKFINYIESLLETFSLSYSDSIGIKSLVLIDDFISPNANEKSLETNLFYIPVKLSLTGNKEGIINFLHYVENVGKIYEEDKDIKIYTDTFLNKNGRKTVLEGDNRKESYPGLSKYNIYENQIIDLEVLKIEEYIDSSDKTRDEEGFLSFIKKTQGAEKIEVEVKLNFYVKGFPHYKLEGFVKEVLTEYEQLKKDINVRLKDTKIRPYVVSKLKNANIYLNEVSKDIGDIRVSLRKKQDLDELYKRAVDYSSIFSSYRKQLLK